MEPDLYDGFQGALDQLVAVATKRIAAGDEDPGFIAEDLVYDVEERLFALADKAWTFRAELEAREYLSSREDFRAMDSIVAMGYAACQALSTAVKERSDSELPPESISYTCILLLTRVVRVGHEICALLRAGFPGGARARWRTLYEMDVVANVLARGNRWTAARFVNHRWIMARKASDFEGTADGYRNEVERECRKLVRRYGAAYATTYGWASELSRRRLNVEKPQFRHLVRIAEIDRHEGYLPASHQNVHADALGALQVVNSDGLLHSGANFEEVREVIAQTVFTLGEAVGAVLRIWSNYSNQFAVLQSLWGELSMSLYLIFTRRPVVEGENDS